MSSVVNLNRARKRRARSQARLAADRNAVLHGLPLDERERARQEEARAQRLWQGGRRIAPADAIDAEPSRAEGPTPDICGPDAP